MTKVWTKFEDQQKQGQQFQEVRVKYRENVKKAEEQLRSLEEQYEAKVQDELANGKDNSSTKGQLIKDIQAAKDAIGYANQDEVKMNEHINAEMAKVRITNEDLVIDYFENYRPSVHAEEIKPIIDRLVQAKSEYFNALFDLYDKEDEYGPIASKALDIARITPVNGATLHVKPPMYMDDLPLIKASELSGAQQNRNTGRLFPSTVERVKP